MLHWGCVRWRARPPCESKVNAFVLCRNGGSAGRRICIGLASDLLAGFPGLTGRAVGGVKELVVNRRNENGLLPFGLLCHMVQNSFAITLSIRNMAAEDTAKCKSSLKVVAPQIGQQRYG